MFVSRRMWSRYAVAGLLAVALYATGQTATSEKPRELTDLSVEELANVEVTTAGKKAQKLA